MAKEVRVLKCPFCKRGEIETVYFPSVLHKRKGTWGGYKPTFKRSADDMIVTSAKCPNCGKSGKEIQKSLKKESIREVSHDERLKRLQEAGLPTKIVSKKD